MTRYRLTGASVPVAGAQWERKDDDREIARRVLNLLADRRMLWKDFSLEIEEHCVTSANRTREQIGVHLDNPEISTELARRLELLQRLFRDFVDEVGPHGGDWDRRRSPMGTDPLSMALGRLRGLVGLQSASWPLTTTWTCRRSWPRSCRIKPAGSSSASTAPRHDEGASTRTRGGNGMSTELERLAEAAQSDGWASISGADVEIFRRDAQALGWREIPMRRGDPGVAVLRPVTREAARPRSLSAVHGLGAQPLHTDGAHLFEPPDLVLLASQDSSPTPTLLWHTRKPGRRQAPHQALQHGIFLVHNRQDSFFTPAVIGGVHRFDPVCMSPCDSRAHTAAAYFAEQLEHAEQHNWSGSQVLLIDNRHVLHARAAVADKDEERTLTRVAFNTGDSR